jgi:putative ABC transport system substrate-binding protein
MRRREFIATLSGAAAWPLLAQAQGQRPIPVVGFLSGNSSSRAPFLNFFREGIKTEGFVESQNVAFEFRSAEGQYDSLPALASELINRKVSVIVADGAVSSPLAAKQATTTIPIVFFTGSDPVQWGLVASLNRPGGNITGVSISYSELLPKRIEIMRELAPQAPVVGLIVNPNNPNADRDAKILSALGEARGWTIKVEKVTTEQDLKAVFDDLDKARVGALTLGNDALLSTWYQQVADFAARYKIPTIFSGREFVIAGGLAAYGPRIGDLYRMLGVYTGRVLKGANPADLPVYYPTQFDLIINLKTAKALGLTAPPSLLARADEVIE